MTKKARFALVALTILGLTVLPSLHIPSNNLNLFTLQPVKAQNAPSQNPQRFIIEDIWRRVYELLPDLPKENQYISKETGKQATSNTLVARLIRYHMYVKGRPPIYRLDWKLTIADYLGVNEVMFEGVYPGGDTLRQNPMDNDRAVITRMTRAQRDALVNTLVSIFNPNVAAESQPTPKPTPTPTPTPNPDRSLPSLPQPGDAQQLKL
ncbi:hypothetical protein IQ264_32135 [Phormidium sp. LEGE 05292]|uniref:hypothetical protein n=1 Tax=[Phormidium] sp. LEGE 05292 TaxID=767427 RepID=UPI00187F2B91|nr:hypothetical protein [Phormidium sp. LEGE 05292]MBE9230053.1 hypothetical protein [Phormidium sp. LEGE 05292]